MKNNALRTQNEEILYYGNDLFRKIQQILQMKIHVDIYLND